MNFVQFCQLYLASGFTSFWKELQASSKRNLNAQKGLKKEEIPMFCQLQAENFLKRGLKTGIFFL